MFKVSAENTTEMLSSLPCLNNPGSELFSKQSVSVSVDVNGTGTSDRQKLPMGAAQHSRHR